MKKISLLFPAMLGCMFMAFSVIAQNTFQKIYPGPGDTKVFHIAPVEDGGFVLSGTANDGFSERVFAAKIDCTGTIEWNRFFASSSSIGNTNQKIIPYQDGYILGASIGSFQNYNIVLIRLDSEGMVIWEKIMNGSRDDIFADLAVTQDNEFIVVGATNSFGADSNTSSNSFKDAYVAKLDQDGELIWSKTFGNEAAIDDARSVIQTADGGFAIIGRLIEKEAFHTMFLKINADGALDFLKTYGDSTHRNYAYDIVETNTGNFVITGSTTLLKTDHTAMPDAYLLETDAAGNINWAKAYLPLSYDQSDSGSSIVMQNDGYLMAVPTMSFYQQGSIVQNKYLLVKTDLSGNLNLAKTYTDGYSHYPKIAAATDFSGYMMAGFSTLETTNFSMHLLKMDQNLNSGCFDIDRTNDMAVVAPPFVQSDPSVQIEDNNGAWLTISSPIDSVLFESMVTCEEILDSCKLEPLITASTIENFNINVFPNPVNEMLYIELIMQHAIAFELVLTNALGQIIVKKSFELQKGETEINLNVEAFNTGMYFLSLKTIGKAKLMENYKIFKH